MESRDALSNKEHSPTQILCIYAVSDEQFYRELQTYLALWQTKGQGLCVLKKREIR